MIRTCGELRFALAQFDDETPVEIYIGGIRNLSGWLSIDRVEREDEVDTKVDIWAQAEELL